MSFYLVTGGAGFIGSHLAQRLLRDGHRVRIADNLSTGRLENLDAVGPAAEFREGDLADPAFAREVVGGVDGVFHQAALPSVPRSVSDPETSNRSNIDATLHLLVAARDASVSRFVFASSSSVYGDAPGLPKREDEIGVPLSPYAITKLTGELYCRTFHSLYGFPTVSLRYFNVFGPRQDPRSTYAAVVPRFIVAALEDGAPRIFGDGLQTRDFTYIDNVVEANLAALRAGDEALGKAYNVACGHRISVLDLAEAICRLCGVECAPAFEDARPGDVRDSLADIEKARSLLGYEPVCDVEEGLRRTVGSWTDAAVEGD